MKHPINRIVKLLATIVILFVVGCNDDSVKTGSIAGFVVDANTGEPVRAANITLSPVGSSSVSGSDGRYEFLALEAGTYTVQVSKSGYITNSKRVVVTEGGVGSGDIMLTPSSGDMSLSVTYIDFGTSQTVETFQIINNASNGSFQWSIIKENTADWLTVSPTSGSCGAGQHSPVTLTVNRALVNTSQTVNLRVTNNTSGNSVTLPVSVGYSNGILQITPNPVDFGNTATVRQMTILNTGSTSITYEINYNCNWLTVSPTGGQLSSGGSTTINLSINRNAFNGTAQTILQVRNTADGSFTNVNVTATNDGGGQGGEIVVPGGLQCYYTFDNGTANDITENGVDAQLMNSASIIGSGDQYLKLNMITDDYLNIPYNLFSGLSNWSVSFWIKDFGAGSIFAAQNSSTSQYNYYDAPLLWAMQDNKLRLKCDANGMPNYSSEYAGTSFSYNYSNIQADGNWHHIVVTMSSGGNAKLYVDGSLRDQITCSYIQNTINACTKIAFGGSKEGLYPFSSSMKLDNIRIYNRAITNTDVQTIYNNEL
ncbi:MAG: carboxypeptidase regulatory-like domain-containing protein [Bacteroidales bacterium]|nr:carboxypeptidase regulatory-like domain-containing protein [Bacteroidales bacterium]